VTDEPHFDNRFLNRCHAVPDKFIIVTQGPHSGVALRWFRDEYCQAEVEEASRRGVDAYDVLDGLAAKSPVGSNGVIFLPYFMGECSPIWDRTATSVFFGITPRCSKSDLIRAIMEGTAFNVKENLDILHDVGVDVKEVIAVGGQSRSLAWLRIRSDIYGKKITTPKAKDTAPLGSAILGGVAAEIYANPAKAEEICKIDETVQPNQETYEVYQEYYKLYKQVYEDLKPSFKTRASIVH